MPICQSLSVNRSTTSIFKRIEPITIQYCPGVLGGDTGNGSTYSLDKGPGVLRGDTYLKSKTTEDIISIGSFVEVLVLNQYVFVKKILSIMPKSIHLDHHDTAHYISMYHRTGGFTGHEREVYKSLISRLIHKGHVLDSTFLDDQSNLRPTFASIGFDCLLDISEKIYPIFVLQFYKSVRIIRNLNGTISISFIINNFEITLSLEEFSQILKIPCQGVYVYTLEWPI
ncbi:hypothetical protein Tco_0896664 [Tanacetum coccineum]